MPAIAAKKGQTYTTGFEAKSHPYQVDSRLHTLKIGLTPLVTILTGGGAGIKGQKNSTFYHHEDELVPATGTVTTADAVASDDLTMANDYVYFQNFDILMNERTKSIVQINDTSLTGADDTILYVGGTDLGSVVGDVYRKLGPAFSEGGTAPASKMTVEVLKTHYLQKFRRTIETTVENELTASAHAGSQFAHELVKKSAEVKIEAEMLAYWGAANSDTGADPEGNSLYAVPTSAGIYHSLTSNLDKAVGTLTLAGIRDGFDMAREYHPEGSWTCIASPFIMGLLDDLLADKIVLQNNATSYGINIRQVRLGANKLNFIEQPLFTGELSKIIFGIPNPITEYFRMCNMTGYPLSWYKNVKTDDHNDSRKDEISGWLGYQLIEEPRWVLFDGIDS